MSREVLGSAGTDAEPVPSRPLDRRTVVTDLDAPAVPAARADRTGSNHRTADPPIAPPPGPRPDRDLVERADERVGERATAADAAVEVDLDADAGPPTAPRSRAAQVRDRLLGTGTPRAVLTLVAAGAVGALLATLVTAGVLQRQHTEARYAAIRVLSEVMLDGSALNGRSLTDRPVDVDLLVLNAGPDAVQVRDASLVDGGRSVIAVREVTEVPAGALVRVPAQADLDCRGPQPRRLELTVRTGDGRDRTLEPKSLSSAFGGGGPLEGIWWACDDTQTVGLEIWAMTAREDGALAMQLRNPSDRDVQVGFLGPAGVRVVVDDGASSVVVGGRDSQFIRLHVVVERCTGAAQRANAAEDVTMTVDGDNVGPLPADTALVAGWLARQVALSCR